MHSLSRTFLKTAWYRYFRVVVSAVLGVAVGGSLVFAFIAYQNHKTEDRNTADTASSTLMYARSAPTHLSIPAIDLEADFEAPLGLRADQTVEVPALYTTVGWYKHGATPGEVGTAVILGHVDSYQGPAVFFNLKQLKVGDVIKVNREDGTTATFIVDEIGRYSRANFPTERVYGQTNTPTLRLITCTGTFNYGKQEYSHNLVIYASLVEN